MPSISLPIESPSAAPSAHDLDDPVLICPGKARINRKADHLLSHFFAMDKFAGFAEFSPRYIGISLMRG